MNKKEGISQHGVGVEYKKVVSTRHDRVNGGDQMSKMSGTKAAFSKGHTDTKKA